MRRGPRAGLSRWGLFLIVLIALALGALGGVAWRSAQLAPAPAPLAVGKSPTVSPGKPGPQRIVLTDAQLTALLRQAVGSASPDGKVTCEPGLIVVTGTYHKGALAAPLRMTFVPTIEHGNIEVHIQDVKVAGASLPQNWAQALGARLKNVLYDEQRKIKGLVLDTIEVRSHELEVTGHLAKANQPGSAPPSF